MSLSDVLGLGSSRQLLSGAYYGAYSVRLHKVSNVQCCNSATLQLWQCVRPRASALCTLKPYGDT